MNKKETIKIQKQGEEAEKSFLKWLDENGFSYLYINQDKESFPTLFKDNVKRPDFMVLIDSIGMIAVDVKNYSLFKFNGHKENAYTLPYEEELKKTLAFERMFRLPVWYAYEHDGEWLWISALKALEVGHFRENKQKNNKTFLVLELKEFVKVSTNEDIGKLWSQRLSSCKNNKLSDENIK